MSTEPYDESITAAVAREAARRKRTLYAFLALLLVPIAIGAYALSRAPKEVERVASDVTPIVAERVSGEISTKVTNDVVQRSESVIKENVTRETNALRSDIEQLRKTTQKQEQSMTALEARVTPADNSKLLQEIQALRVQMARESASLRAEIQALDDRVQKLEKPRLDRVPR
jgi:predicted  nucleic acid-binding Zn-ribbon protein